MAQLSTLYHSRVVVIRNSTGITIQWNVIDDIIQYVEGNCSTFIPLEVDGREALPKVSWSLLACSRATFAPLSARRPVCVLVCHFTLSPSLYLLFNIRSICMRDLRKMRATRSSITDREQDVFRNRTCCCEKSGNVHASLIATPKTKLIDENTANQT